MLTTACCLEGLVGLALGLGLDLVSGWLEVMSNFYSPINGRSTYINTKNNIMAIREAKKTTTPHRPIHNLTKQKHYYQ